MTSCYDQDTYDVWQVLGTTVTLSDRSVSASQESSDRAAHNVATPEDDSMAAGNGNTSMVQKLDDARGRAGREQRFACPRGQVPDIVCVEPAKSTPSTAS